LFLYQLLLVREPGTLAWENGGSRMIVTRTGRRAPLIIAMLIASHFPCEAACDISDEVRYAAYRPFLELATDEVTAVFKKNDNYSFNTAVDELTKKNVPLLKVGDARAVRLLIGLGLFTAQATNTEPLDVTFKLACEAAKRGLAPRNVGDPLACALTALYGSRRDDTANRTLAREMVELAKANLAIDPDSADAKHRFEIVAPIIGGCSS
jgi:hypothetical protein